MKMIFGLVYEYYLVLVCLKSKLENWFFLYFVLIRVNYILFKNLIRVRCEKFICLLVKIIRIVFLSLFFWVKIK